MNARIHESGNLEIKRFFALDSRAYEEGALPVKTKELLGLVASLVLRCDDCVTYHIVRCREEGVTRDEFFETFNVGARGRRIDHDSAPAPRGGHAGPGGAAVMSMTNWLEMAKADAEKRGLARSCRCSTAWPRRCRRCGTRPTASTATTPSRSQSYEERARAHQRS